MKGSKGSEAKLTFHIVFNYILKLSNESNIFLVDFEATFLLVLIGGA